MTDEWKRNEHVDGDAVDYECKRRWSEATLYVLPWPSERERKPEWLESVEIYVEIDGGGGPRENTSFDLPVDALIEALRVRGYSVEKTVA